MWLLVGLGNPGSAYEHNRHNVGIMALDRLASDYGMGSAVRKFQSLLGEAQISGNKALILAPQTFMNRSGDAVLAAAQFYKIPPDKVIVFHDDLDLAFGKVRVKTGGGHGGHNGLRDIDAKFSNEYIRVRIGIGRPPEQMDVSPYVLGNFSKPEQAVIDKLCDYVSASIPALLADDANGFMSKVALLMNPPQPKIKKEEKDGL